MTIKDLAAKTGYSVGTVSRALNHHPNVSDTARAVILKAARDSDFELNQNAKQLKQQHSTTILVVVRGIGNELFAELVENIQHLVAKTRYQLVVDYLDEAMNEVHRAEQLCREKKPLGILFLGGNIGHFTTDFEKIDVPCVLVTNDASSLRFSNLSSVCTDDTEAGRKAVDTLVSLGHKRIAVIGGDITNSDTSRLRYEGCLDSFRRHGIDFDPMRDCREVRFSYQDGFHATQALIREGRNFTALFAMSDVMAIGAIRALRENGMRVPEDVSVLGVDGLPLGMYYVPQLSTIRQSARQIASRSVEILLDCMENNAKARHERIPFEVLCRESIRRIHE